MSDKMMYFGNRNLMRWVKCPAYNTSLSVVDWNTQNAHLNGGATVLRSGGSHREYNFQWNLASQEEIYKITDYDSGIYGNGLIYFLDPFAANTNMFPAHLAAPGLAITNPGTPTLRGFSGTAAATPANTYGYPTMGVNYATGNTGQDIIWFPVPQGYKIALGVTGSGTGQFRYRWDNGTSVTMPYLTVTSGVRANTWLTPPTNALGITILMPTSGTVFAYGLFAQVVESTAVSIPSSIANGPFISGRGHSGCRFGEPPAVTGYSSAMDKLSASARLVEVGSWERS